MAILISLQQKLVVETTPSIKFNRKCLVYTVNNTKVDFVVVFLIFFYKLLIVDRAKIITGVREMEVFNDSHLQTENPSALVGIYSDSFAVSNLHIGLVVSCLF